MSSKKNYILLGVIFVFLVIPIVPQQQTYANYTIREISDDSSDLTEKINLPKFLPPPPTNQNYTYSYFNSRGVDIAENIFLTVGDFFPFSNIPTTRLHDLTSVQYVLTCIDLFYVLEDVNYLNLAWSAADSLYLDVNGTYIIGDDLGTSYEMYADENFQLVIMYERLARALEVDEDYLNANFIWGKANSLMTNLVNLFYDPVSNVVNTTISLSLTNFTVIGTSPVASAKATGLFSMANHLANDSSIYYTETKNAVDFYRLNGNRSFTLPTGDFGFLYQTTISGGGAGDNEADLQGNIYMNTALAQHSEYSTKIGDISSGFDYFNWTTMGEETMKEFLKSPDTELFHTKYEFGGGILEDVALTYENSLYLSHLVEYKRIRLSITGITPSFMEINDLFESLYFSVFLEPDFFLAGITKTGAILDLIYDIPHSNPNIVNYQVVTMMLKFYPLVSMLAYPLQIQLNQPNQFEWVFDLAETTSIFGSSNKSFSLNFKFQISSLTIFNIQYPENYRLNTSMLDGVRHQNAQPVKFNVTSAEGGYHDITFSLYLANFLVFDNSFKIFIEKSIIISTEPTNLEVTELQDRDLILTVYLEDETGLGIDGAEVNLFLEFASGKIKFTDSFGYVTFYIPLDELKPAIPFSDDQGPTFNSTIWIVAFKDKHITNLVIKEVTINLNSLILDLNPSPPEVKEASDLSLYLDVQSRLEATIFNPEARIKINNITYVDKNHMTSWKLPTTVIIGKSWLRNGTSGSIIVDVIVTADGLSEPQHFSFEVYVEPLGTLERIYLWFETALQNDVVKILGALGVIWGLLWRQFSLYVIKRTRRCPYCGDVTKRKYQYCKNCGLKDESLEYRKEVKKKQKEARIVTAETESLEERTHQPAQPTIQQPQVEEKFDNTYNRKNNNDNNY